MKGSGSARGLWNCLLDRRHGDMETSGRRSYVDAILAALYALVVIWRCEEPERS